MHWILQNNLFNEAAYTTLLETLQRFGIPYSIHKVIPFIGELVPEPEIGHQNVICMGSYSLRHSARKFGWSPGVFDLEPWNFLVQLQKWGDEMLNFDSKVCAFKDARFPQGEELAFIRPIEDSKVFAGRVFEKDEFMAWQHKVVDLEEDYGNSLTKDTLVQVCKPKLIYAEYRFWIIGTEIVCASLYKVGDRVRYSDQVDERFFDYVRRMITPEDINEVWLPHEAFVIDVCETPDGLKIVEINTLNSCGFYAADIPKLVFALEENFSEHPNP